MQLVLTFSAALLLSGANACPFASKERQRGLHEQAAASNARRATNIASWTPFYTPTATAFDWAQLQQNVAAAVAQGLGPNLIRLAFIDATQSGGAHAWLLVDNSAPFGDAALLASLLLGIESTKISHADALAFAAASAIGSANKYGATVRFRPGRADAVTPIPEVKTDATFPYANVTITHDSISKWEYVDPTGRMMLPVDMSLIQDAQYRLWVDFYASNEQQFVSDFVVLFGLLLELNVAPGLSLTPIDTSVQPQPAVSPPASTWCYPSGATANPILCATITPSTDGISTQYTVHSLIPGWAAIGVGSTSMANGDAVVGWPQNNSNANVQFLTTRQHSIQINTNSAWRQVALDTTTYPVPSWARVSFTVLHLSTVAGDAGVSGNSPDGNGMNASDFYQHEISGVLMSNGGAAVGGDGGGISMQMIVTVAMGVALLVGAAGGKRSSLRVAPPSPRTFQRQVDSLVSGETVTSGDPLVWSVSEVAAWVLQNGGDEQAAEVVRKENLGGRAVVAMGLQELCGLLGVVKYGDRVLFGEALKAMKMSCGRDGEEDAGVELPLYY
ncbi:hypothetical protein HDU98_006539 [Podochytrium sp. JEL0797]|nr:hypothetical protein HDU98_006539 [Podochytrium sp. JEL0797]